MPQGWNLVAMKCSTFPPRSRKQGNEVFPKATLKGPKNQRGCLKMEHPLRSPKIHRSIITFTRHHVRFRGGQCKCPSARCWSRLSRRSRWDGDWMICFFCPKNQVSHNPAGKNHNFLDDNCPSGPTLWKTHLRCTPFQIEHGDLHGWYVIHVVLGPCDANTLKA
jgi:hypothetical protein